MRKLLWLSLLLMSLFPAPAVWAQAPKEQKQKPKYSPEFGLHAGPLIPSHIGGVQEVLPVWGLRFGTLTKMGTIEVDAFNARAYGIVYNSLSADYRLDIENDYIPCHFLIGFRLDYLKPSDEPSYKIAGGWHYGGGIIESLGGPWAFRADFKYRFSPGQSLYIGLGLMYRFPAETESDK